MNFTKLIQVILPVFVVPIIIFIACDGKDDISTVISSFNASNDSVEVVVGDSVDIFDIWTVSLSGDDNAVLYVSSSDEEVVDYTTQDYLRALKVGTAIISADLIDVDTIQTGSVFCTVIAEPDADNVDIDVTGITVIGTAIVDEGATTQLTATIAPSDATDKTVTWSAENGNATVDTEGLVTGVTAGTCTITATANDGSGITGTLEVTVEAIEVTSITVTGTATVEEGATTQLATTVLPDDASDNSVTWSAENGNATVDTEGLVTGVTAGTCTITATANDGSGITGTLEVTVEAIEVTSITVTGTATVEEGATTQLATTVLPEDASNKSVTWSAENGNATVDTEGLVTGVSAGTCVITATAADGSGITGTLEVTVTESIPAFCEFVPCHPDCPPNPACE